MGVLTQPVETAWVKPVAFERWVPWAVSAGWLVLSALVVAHHEPWFDEAQAWLLARDSSFTALWTRLLRYEGSPGLWHSILWVLVRLGVPYAAVGLVSACFGAAGCALLLWRSPFPLAIRCLLPFTYFLLYQYSVVARSYVLLPLLLFAAANLFWNARRQSWQFALILGALSLVSVHGLIISAALCLCTGLWRKPKALLLYGAFVVVAIAAARPAHDVTFVTAPNFQIKHMIAVSAIAFREAFAASWILSGIILALSARLLWQGRSAYFFLIASAGLCLFSAVIYGHVWHQGLLFLVWLTAMWIAARRVPIHREALASLALVIAVQIWWSVSTIRFDWTEPYSGSKAAAAYLETLPHPQVAAFGVGSIALEPYFSHNPFVNYHDPAFEQWSTANTMDSQGLEMVRAKLPEYALISVKRSPELEQQWTRAVTGAGYVLLRHFDGNIYWRTRVLEPESFDLYRQPVSAQSK